MDCVCVPAVLAIGELNGRANYFGNLFVEEAKNDAFHGTIQHFTAFPKKTGLPFHDLTLAALYSSLQHDLEFVQCLAILLSEYEIHVSYFETVFFCESIFR